MPELLLRGISIGTIKGVLFDKDGTLSNSEADLSRLAELRIKEANNIFRSKAYTLKQLIELETLLAKAYGVTKNGIDPNGIIAIASKSDNLIATATVFCIIEKNIYFNSKGMKLLPGVIQFLKDLQKANVICALISNDTSLGIESFLRKNNLEDIFLQVWSAENQPAKPDPAAVKNLCDLLGLKPAECALVGDADTDLLMAREAGIGVALGYSAGWSQSPQITAHQELIQHWDELTVLKKPKVPKGMGSQ